MLAKDKTAKDFVSDAFAHCKFIAHSPEALPLFEKAGVAADNNMTAPKANDATAKIWGVSS